MNRDTMDEMRRLFYTLWSKAEAMPGYDQGQWFRLQNLICELLEAEMQKPAICFDNQKAWLDYLLRTGGEISCPRFKTHE